MRKRDSWLVLSLVLLLSLAAAWQALGVGFDYDFQRFFPVEDPDTEYYQRFRERFGPDNNYLLIGLEREAGLFDSAFLAQVDDLTQALEGWDMLTEVQSPTNLSYYRRDPLFGLMNRVPYLHPGQPSRYASDSAQVYQREALVGSYFAADRQSVSILARHPGRFAEAECACLADSLEQILARYAFEGVHTAGRCIGQRYYTQLMQREVLIFVGASVLLVLVFLALTFRRWWGVLLPLTVVGLAVLWTVALMRLTGQSLDVISNVIPSILLVVGLSAVIHILAQYQGNLRAGQPQSRALRQALRQVGSANLLTALTTAVGFLTLLTARIQPIEAFALYATAGVMIAFGLTYAILPAALALLPRAPAAPDASQGGDRFDRWLHRSYRWLLRHPRSVLLGSLLVALLSAAGLSQLRVNNYLLEDLKADNPLRQDFEFYAEHYAGARGFELVLTKPDSLSWSQRATWVPVADLHRYLAHTYGVGQLVSPLTLVRGLNRAWAGDDRLHYRLPRDPQRFDRIWQQVQRYRRRLQLDAYLGDATLRISGLMPDLGSQVVARRDAALARWAQDHLPPGYRYRLTGVPTLLDKGNRLVAGNVFTGLLVAFALIAGLMGLIFRSARMVLIALVPNVLPLLMIGGLMGALGIDLKLSTAIIFTIAFGIAVDDTIHFMNRLRWELQAGRSLPYAIKRSFLSTGKAIVMTTLILAGGFLTLTLSEFLGTFYIGLLVSLTLVFALLADLLLLPVLLWLGGGAQLESLAKHAA